LDCIKERFDVHARQERVTAIDPLLKKKAAYNKRDDASITRLGGVFPEKVDDSPGHVIRVRNASFDRRASSQQYEFGHPRFVLTPRQPKEKLGQLLSGRLEDRLDDDRLVALRSHGYQRHRHAD
jgi:hypothetical protein